MCQFKLTRRPTFFPFCVGREKGGCKCSVLPALWWMTIVKPFTTELHGLTLKAKWANMSARFKYIIIII